MIGKTLGQYEVLEMLGKGGMGEVYRARDTKLDRDVAIKMLPPHLTDDNERLARFEREAKVLASLNHPNIAAIYGLEEADGVPFLVMELVEGDTLADRIAKGRLELDETLQISRQIAEGLEAAHESGIIHRDLKPANVKVTPEGRVKVLDFGLARAYAEEASEDPAESPTITVEYTRPGTLLGTAAYMSPEQARGKPIDRRVDVWAFGCVLYECLTAERAFAGETLSDVLVAVLQDEPDWTRLPCATPGHVRALLARCLVKDPRRRLRDVGDAGLLLAESEHVAPVDASSLQVREANSVRTWSLVLVAAVLAFLVGVLLRSEPPTTEPPRVTQLTFSGEDYQPSVSPDGRLIAFTSGRAGISQIWLRQVDGVGEQPLTEGPDWRPRFSPDGTAVTFIRSSDETSAAFRVPVVGGQPRKLIEDVTEVELSPDGGQLAFVRGAAVADLEFGSQVGVLDLETGDERILQHMQGWDLFGIGWSPDGRRLCVTKSSLQAETGDWRTLLLDPETGELEELHLSDSGGPVSGATWAGPSGLVVAISPTTVSGTPAPSRIIRFDLDTQKEELLLWAPNLFPFRGSLNTTTQLGVIDTNSLVFDSYLQTQSLYEVAIASESGSERKLIAGISIDRQPSYHPDGSRILFTSNRAGNVDLFSYEFETGKLLQLTDHAAGDWDGAYTPDGTAILFSSERSGNLEIWTADVDGANPRQVTHDGVNAENPTMTRDGRWITYSSGHPDHPGIFKIRSDGTDPQELVAGNYVQPEVSPDGRHVLFVATDNARLLNTVYAVDLETGTKTPFEVVMSHGLRSPNVTYGRGRWMPNVTYGRGRWMPDGSAIVFVGLDEEGRTGLWAQDFRTDRNTTETRRRITGFDSDMVHESFGISPDGESITLSAIEQVRTINQVDRLPDLR